MQSITLSTKQMEDLHQRLRQLPDCRKPLGLRHPFASVLTLSLAAVLAGSRGYTAIAEWVGTQSQLKRLRARFNPKTQRFEPPSEPTVRRVLQAADAQAVDRTFGEWMMRMTPADEPIAVDGKTLCGARRENGTQVHLLSALLQKMGAGVAQHEVPQKTNEIPEIKALLKPSISKAVSSADAMHTQTDTARYLVEEGRITCSRSRTTNPPCTSTSKPSARRIFPPAPPSKKPTGALKPAPYKPPPASTTISTSPMSGKSRASPASACP